MNQTLFAESKEKLLELCKIMDSYLNKGDFFELYSCWVGEEDEKRNGEFTLPLNKFNIDQHAVKMWLCCVL